MQVPILSGIYTDNNSDIRTSYPRNMVPVPKSQGVSNGYLRPGDGIALWTTGEGADRGAINWRGDCYRVSGTKLIKIVSTGGIKVLGTITGTDQASLDYSFDRLAIAADNKLWYCDGSTLTEVTDPDLGDALDVIWVDGYFMTTDGEFIVVTELLDPEAVDPLKYGSSEADPDPVLAIIKIRNEPYVLNRHSIEVFDNVGGSGFPFQRIEGAQIQKGVIGTHACCEYKEAVAFLGGARNEAPAIWLGLNGQSRRLSTREIDQVLEEYTTAQLEDVVLESRLEGALEQLYVHLPDKTLVYDGNASQNVEQLVWYELGSGLESTQYLARNFVWCHDKWIVGNPNTTDIGYLDKSISSHWGNEIGWDFSSGIMYNDGNSALLHELELVSLPGRSIYGEDPVIFTDYSFDGVSYSAPKGIKAGKTGDRTKRLVWYKAGAIRNWRIQRFYGTSEAHISVLRLEAQIEPLYI